MRATEFIEASYKGNLGMMEMMKFFKVATPEEKELMKRLIAQGDQESAWKLLQQVTDTELVNELFDTKSSFEITDWDDQFGPQEVHAKAYDRQGNYININFVPVRKNIVDVEFSRNDSFDVTGQGDAERVFGTVLQATKRYLEKYRPPAIVFTGKTGSRSKLYQRLVNRFAQQFGYKQMDINRYSEKAKQQIAASGSDAFVLRDTLKGVGESGVSAGGGQHKWMGNEPYRHLVEKDVDENMTRRGFLGALGAAAATGAQAATGLKPPKEYNLLGNNPNNEIAVQKTALGSGLKGTELAQFLGQVKHESWNFERLKEKSAGKDYFEKRYGVKYAPNTAKILGNKVPGDGQKYHGRGFIQLTGRDNYRMAGQALGIDLLSRPELAAKPDIAAKIAIWYWKTRVKPTVQNFADTVAVTKAINPAMRGLEDRHANFKDYMRII